MPVTIACQTLFHVLGTQEWPQEQTHKKQSPLTPLSTRPLGTQEGAVAGSEAALRKAGARSRPLAAAKRSASARRDPSALSVERWALPGGEEAEPLCTSPRNDTQRQAEARGPGARGDWSFGFSSKYGRLFLIKKCYTGRLEFCYNNLDKWEIVYSIKKCYTGRLESSYDHVDKWLGRPL